MISLKVLATAVWLNSLVPSSYDVARGETPQQRYDRMLVLAKAWDAAAEQLMCTGGFQSTEDRPCRRRWPGTYVDLIVSLGTQGWFETKIDRALQEGVCKDHQCDPGWARDPKNRRRLLRNAEGQKIRVFLARGTFQVQRSTRLARKHWDHLTGTGLQEATNAALVIGDMFGKRYCKGDPVRMFGAMGGRACQAPPTASGRARAAWAQEKRQKYYNIRGRLQAEMRSAALSGQEYVYSPPSG